MRFRDSMLVLALAAATPLYSLAENGRGWLGLNQQTDKAQSIEQPKPRFYDEGLLRVHEMVSRLEDNLAKGNYVEGRGGDTVFQVPRMQARRRPYETIHLTISDVHGVSLGGHDARSHSAFINNKDGQMQFSVRWRSTPESPSYDRAVPFTRAPQGLQDRITALVAQYTD